MNMSAAGGGGNAAGMAAMGRAYAAPTQQTIAPNAATRAYADVEQKQVTTEQIQVR